MLYHAKNGNVKIGNSDMDYISFGRGSKNLIMIPGLGDGLTTVKGSAIPLALMYREFAKEYKVYVFSRKNHLEEGYSTKEMAADLVLSMNQLCIEKASIMGISQGGMIAQYVAIDYPEVVDKLILGVTVSRQNETIQSVVKNWIAMANNNDYRNIFIDTAEKSYSEKSLKKYRPLYPVLSRVGKPKSLKRFLIQANSCLNHNAYDKLEKIKCKTLVIGGDSDHVVGPKTSEEIANQIADSKLIVYEGLGHMAYEEVKDFNQQVLQFLRNE